MRNVFIAVGGSGTKVAEALVRLLAIGFPTRQENGTLTSAGDSLQIWRLDPDRNSGAAIALGKCLKDYEDLQGLLNGANRGTGIASSRWAMDIDSRVRHLDPLQLPRSVDSDNSVKKLGGILDSRYGGIKSSLPFLAPFYEQKDLEVEIDRGFYQKPFIGAAVMAVFAESLRDENSPGGKACSLTGFQNVSTNFFLCGSLHGGTGASGVPIMGKYLGSLKRQNQSWDWRVGACLLTPYCVPPQPPFGLLREGTPTPQQIDDLVKAYGDKPAFAGLTIEDKRKLVEQILLGFFAEPEAMEARARQGLAYYRDHSVDYFDELYLAGKPEPDKLKVWSNGGESQSNPLNSAEVVAALGALNFFARAGTSNPESYVIPTSTPDLNSERMRLRDLPSYTVGQTEIDPEQVFFASAVMHHLVTKQIPWEISAKGFPKELDRLRKVYEGNEDRKLEDFSKLSAAAALLGKTIMTTLDPNPQFTIGWSGEDSSRILPYLSNDSGSVKDITAKTARKFLSKEARGELDLGDSSIRVTTFEFGEWCPGTAEFTRGEYLRLVWHNLLTRAHRRLRVQEGADIVNGNRKDFLNNGILGGGAGVAEKKGFRAVRTEYITSPDYDPKYFETFPTSWAAAYAFRKTLDLPAMATSGVDGGRFAEEVSLAVEEWVTLFLLQYFGILFLTESKQVELLQEYDKDLWLALSGTYPSAREEPPRSIKLLQHGETVVGAFYPSVIFFPARDRTRWLKDKTLADYILDGRLSWTRSRRILLSGDKEQRDFHAHLRAIAEQPVLSRGLRDRLYDFCEAHFQGTVDAIPNLDADPAKWDVPGLKKWDSEELLEMYPLRKPKRWDAEEGESPGRVFYLVNGMPEYTPWMKSAILPSGPAPYQYRKVTEKQIAVELPGRKFVCNLRTDDTIVLLKSLFLDDPPHWCKMPKASDTHAAHIKPLHRVELRDPVVTEKDIAICLAPVSSELLAHFPELQRDLDHISVSPNVEGSSVEWTIPIMGREVRWQTRPSYAKGLTASSLALWPPRVSSAWRLYAAYGVGPKEDSGRWHLVDQNGKLGKLIEVEEEEYVSVLYGSAAPNQPRAMVLFDSGDRERGVLFFADFGGDQTPSQLEGKLAVDFGTSNTSLAYSLGAGQPETLRFQLTPKPIWGMRRDLQHREQPGFFPYEWSATTTKGFYPTILLTRRSDARLTDELEPEHVSLDHLFKVDIPGLHRDLEQRLYEGSLNATWKPHSNLKWDLDGRTEPWRTLFLELTLLYAHADLFFTKRALVDHYVFTFPLAFRKDDRESYHTKVKTALKQVRYYCYGASLMANVSYDDQVDESTAIAESVGAVGTKATMELFIDVGGGTCDVAVSHDRKFLVLDSIRVAGNTFFQFAKKSFSSDLEGAVQFKKHLGKLLQGTNDGELKVTNTDPSFGLDIVYSVGISGLADQQFKEREATILRKGMGTFSYQRYRTRLFFRHIITYSLLQACAAVVNQKIKLSSGINVILGGNGWGLMMFAEFARDSHRLREEAAAILNTLKANLAGQATEEELQYINGLKISNLILLNEENLSKAKTNVALGALIADQGRRNGDRSMTMPYTGVTLEELSLSGADPKTVRWCERWGVSSFREKFPGVEQVEDGSFTLPEDLERPFNRVLQAFTSVGNVRSQDQDNMPAEAWTNLNGRLADFVSTLRGNVERLEVSPINHFLSEVLYSKKASRDYLDTLAEVNGNYRSAGRED